MNFNGRMPILLNALRPGKAACSARFSSPASGPRHGEKDKDDEQIAAGR